MSKSILFIAVQCYQCSTMQVKQQKKSSNKWNCAICNEKQSIRKVYAQSYKAKDIRHIVQSFNMSRNVSDEVELQQSCLEHFVEHLEGDNVISVEDKVAKRRSDWTEFVDDVDEESLEPDYLKSKLLDKHMTECKVVTELPDDLMFKKPKLKGNFGSSSLKAGENQAYRTQFSRKSGATKELMKSRPGSSNLSATWNEINFNVEGGNQSLPIISQLQQRLQKSEDLTKNEPGSSNVSTAWTEIKSNVEDIDHSRGISGRFQQRLKESKGSDLMKRGASRWDEYLTIEDNDYHFERKKACFTDDSRLTDENKVQTNDAELLVEDEIHPDFM